MCVFYAGTNGFRKRRKRCVTYRVIAVLAVDVFTDYRRT